MTRRPLLCVSERSATRTHSGNRTRFEISSYRELELAEALRPAGARMARRLAARRRSRDGRIMNRPLSLQPAVSTSPTPMHPRFRVLLGLVLLVGALATTSTPASARRAPYVRDEIVQITGVVTDLTAEPVAGRRGRAQGLPAVLRLPAFPQAQPGRARDPGRSPAPTARFQLEWPWDKGFNRFELAFGITVTQPGGEYFHVLHREDLSRRIRLGSPVISTVQLEDTSFLESYREFRRVDLRRGSAPGLPRNGKTG